MGEKFQKSALPTLFNFVRVRAAHQPHVTYVARTKDGRTDVKVEIVV